MADIHLTRAVFEDELEAVARYRLSVEWKLFDVHWKILRARNEPGAADPSHRQSEAELRFAYDAFTAP